jgi:TolB protein
MQADGSNVKRLTFEGEENARASVSSDGKTITMVHRNSGDYQIAVMELATGNLSILTDGTLDESPSFAPNGSMIIYATTKGDRAELEIVSADGRVRLPVKTDVDIREPAWSPLNNK